MQNTQVINEIIEIEARAHELIQSAKREQEDLPLKISEILEEHKDKYYKKANAKIEEARTAEEKSAQEKITRIYKDREGKLDKLKKVVDENLDSWVEEVYNFIINPV